MKQYPSYTKNPLYELERLNLQIMIQLKQQALKKINPDKGGLDNEEAKKKGDHRP
jgi:hypothetical protein